MTSPMAAGRAPTVSEYESSTWRLIARHRRLTNSTGTVGTTPQSVMRIDDVPVTAGRGYVVMTNNVILISSVANDRASVRMTHTLDGSTPTTSSTFLALYNSAVMPTSGDGNEPSLSALVAPVVDGLLSVLLFVSRVSGTGAVSIAASPYPIDLCIYDVGTIPAASGVDL